MEYCLQWSTHWAWPAYTQTHMNVNICTYLAWKFPFNGRKSMGGTNVNATQTVTAILGSGAFLLDFLIRTGAIVIARLVRITVIHQAAISAVIRWGVNLIAQIIEKRNFGRLQLLCTSSTSGTSYWDLDVAVGRLQTAWPWRAQVLIVLWYGLLNGRMCVRMCCPVAEIRCALPHAGHARRHLCVRHADGGRHT